MKLILLKCYICSAWYGTRVHTHCPICGSFPLQVTKAKKKYYRLVSDSRVIEVVRGFKFAEFKVENLVAMAQVLVDNNHSINGSK